MPEPPPHNVPMASTSLTRRHAHAASSRPPPLSPKTRLSPGALVAAFAVALCPPPAAVFPFCWKVWGGRAPLCARDTVVVDGRRLIRPRPRGYRRRRRADGDPHYHGRASRFAATTVDAVRIWDVVAACAVALQCLGALTACAGGLRRRRQRRRAVEYRCHCRRRRQARWHPRYRRERGSDHRRLFQGQLAGVRAGAGAATPSAMRRSRGGLGS